MVMPNTPLEQAAYGKMHRSNLEYHNIDHIFRCFDYYKNNNVVMTETLRVATWYHDVVYDNLPNKEVRSTFYLQAMVEDHNAWARRFPDDDLAKAKTMILGTINHNIITNPYAKDLIKADLYDLTFPDRTIRNFVKIMDESTKLYGISKVDFAKANRSFMDGLLQVCRDNREADDDKEYWDGVLRGISITKKMAKSFL